MKDNDITAYAVPEADAAKRTAENKHGYVWPFGLYVIIDNERCVIETRSECDEFIAKLKAAADELWPIRPVGQSQPPS